MLSRSKAVIRLIKIRKLIADKENELDSAPDDYQQKLKKELDELLIDVIGVPQEGRHQVNNILHKAVKGEIKPQTAVVAVHEIYNDFQKKKQNNSSSGKNSGPDKSKKKNYSSGSRNIRNGAAELEELYKSGYR